MENDNRTERLQITLPKNTIRLIDGVWPKGPFKSRSSFLDHAARRYAVRLQKATLKRRLKNGYLARAERESELMSEWETASNELIWDEEASESSRP